MAENFRSICDILPHNYQLTVAKLKTVPHLLHLLNDEGVCLNKLISSDHDVRKINEKIITYLIVKLCYSGNNTSLTRLYNVMAEMGESAGFFNRVQHSS